MSKDSLTANDYPVAEKWPNRVKGSRGKSLDEVSLDAAVAGDLTMEDLRITPEALRRQAQIARSVGRAALAGNFDRAAEMTLLPQEVIMEAYELLRPGRATSVDDLRSMASRLRQEFDAPLLAAFMEEAAAQYEARGLFKSRF